MSDPVLPESSRASLVRRIAGVGIGVVVGWLLVIASLQAQLPDPSEAFDAVRRPDNPGPVISAIRVNVDGREVDRAEIEHDILLTAEIQESKTAVSHLLFNWTVPVGEIRGEGPSVAWHIPKGTATPVSPVPTLEVVEQYPDFEAGLVPAVREHRAVAEGPIMHVNDSIAEITKISRTFLVDYFGNSKVSPEACLVDFSDTCRGKEDELGDIIENRSKFLIRSVEARVSKIEFHPSMNAANVTAPCTFRDIDRTNGRPHITVADCILTAVYDKPRWYLCDSHTTNGANWFEDEAPPPGARKP